MTESILAAVQAALASVGPGLHGVACSGGADSMALADAAIRCAGAPHVVVVTIDHGLREGSAAVAEAVVAWARGQGAAGLARRVTVTSRGSLEAAARDARYAALDAVADELGLASILVAHTARDQAETVLLRLLRGTGPAGLAAIPARRGRNGYEIVRPLLAIERDAIDAYVAARGLPTWDDPMNRDPRHARVRVREQLLPMLARENPELPAALVRLAASTREWLDVIDALAAPFAQLPIDCPTLARQPPAIRKRALALALAPLSPESDHLGALDALVCAQTAGQRCLDIPGGRVVRSYDRLDIDKGIDKRIDTPVVAPAGHVVRTWQPGDRMRPARLGGRSRKLSDLFIDAKVPRALRTTARVVVRIADGEIVWAEHLGLAHGANPEVVSALLPTSPDHSGSTGKS